jgi:hypothetical protein
MGEGVAADFMPFLHLAAQQIRMQFAVDADDEKGGAHIHLTQGIEDLSGYKAGIGTIVEGQGDLSILAALRVITYGEGNAVKRSVVIRWRVGSNSMTRWPECG